MYQSQYLIELLETIAGPLEELRILKEHELNVWVEHPAGGHPPVVRERRGGEQGENRQE